jgi:nucleoside-diphosphate-sugar epimerase
MIAAAERAFGRKAIRLPIPRPLLATLGHANACLKVLPGYTPMLTPEKVRELAHPDWVAHAGPALLATGWKPGIPIERGFPATISWYQLHSLL